MPRRQMHCKAGRDHSQKKPELRRPRGGSDGLDVIRPLIAGAGALLRPGGQLVIEIADCQRDAVIELAKASDHLRDPAVLKDHEGLWRVLVAERK
jgi:release factor glutamine methyltransferase